MTQPTRRPRQHSSGGFSLAEVLVACALLAVILLAVFGLITAGVKQAFGGKKMTQATVIAQSVLEQANIQVPQNLLNAASSDTSKTQSWTKTAPATITEAVETSGTGFATRNAWRTLLLNADLPASSSKPATLTVTMTPVPSGTTFGTATMVRIVVDLTWWEYGARPRQVRLQAMNLHVVPS